VMVGDALGLASGLAEQPVSTKALSKNREEIFIPIRIPPSLLRRFSPIRPLRIGG